MKITKYFYIIAVAFIATFYVSPAYAENFGEKSIMKEEQHIENISTKTAQFEQNQLQNIIKSSDILIAYRLKSLNTQISRIQNDNKLTSDEKTNLTSEIQTSIKGLTTLKTKIDADTDATTARSDAKQIITNYLFGIKIHLLIAISDLQATSANLQTLIPQIQNIINTMKSEGKNTSQMQTLLTDASSQLGIMNTTLTTDKTTINNISINTSNLYNSALFQVRQDISKPVQNLTKIKTDFSQIRKLIKESRLSDKQTTPTVSPNLTP